MASTECYRGSGAEPRAGSRGRVPGQGVRGLCPPEAESFLGIGHTKEGANWPHVRVLNERNCYAAKQR